ncbi:MAG: hypothetical protein MR343_00170 [Clostridia bacterium]|nr:hypothetical protein [Clostridia bacterium]MDD7700712.1 hypothetical protein [Eubacteriales bacterium]MDY2827409.1 hypothetical protein [Eubacteriales bacterium]
MVLKILKIIPVCLLFLCFFILPASAGTTAGNENGDPVFESGEFQGALSDFYNALPPEAAEYLPSDFFSGDPEKMGTAVAEKSDAATLLRSALSALGLSLSEKLRLFAGLCGILLLSALLRAVFAGQESEKQLRFALSLCTTLAVFALLFGQGFSEFSAIRQFFTLLGNFTAALLPLMGVLFAMGGNIRAAVANHAVLQTFLSLLSGVLSGSVLPVSGVCLFLSLPGACGGPSLSRLSVFIKRSYTLSFSFLMSLLCFVLGLQSTLSKGSDSLALHSVRFAAGSFLPVVGGSVSEALRTVSGSVVYLRATVGGGAILILFSLFLPVFFSVLCTRIVLLLAASAAGLLDCDREGTLLSEIASVYGYFLAVIASLFVLTVFSLTLFARCATAI